METPNHQIETKPPQDFDVIEDVSPVSSEEQDVIYAGIVEVWQLLEFVERAKTRPYITGTVMIVWAIGIIASALRFFITGDFLLIIPPALISVPLYIVLKFYYKSG